MSDEKLEAFISWSGEVSRSTAEALKKLIQKVLPFPPVFVASRDLKGGDVWFTEIMDRLDRCDVGVLVITRENLSAPWLYFEAGAIAKKVGRSAIIPLLCGVTVGELAGTPLAQIQARALSRESVLEICQILRDRLGLQFPDDQIAEQFDVWWPKLEDEITSPSKRLEKASRPTANSEPAVTLKDISVQVTALRSDINSLSAQFESSRDSWAQHAIRDAARRNVLREVNWLSPRNGLLTVAPPTAAEQQVNALAEKLSALQLAEALAIGPDTPDDDADENRVKES